MKGSFAGVILDAFPRIITESGRSFCTADISTYASAMALSSIGLTVPLVTFPAGLPSARISYP
jgi:hypothetical protein